MATVEPSHDEHERRLDEVIARYLQLQAEGQTPMRAQWLAQFPDLTAELDEFLDDAALVRAAFQLLEPSRFNANKKSSLDHDNQSGASSVPPATSHEQLLGQIGRYRIERLLGEGGFGRVYLAYDNELHRSVAVKVPHAHLVSRSEDAELYLAEARTVAGLDHPNIVPVHDVGKTDEFPCYVVSKYVDGKTLSEYFQGVGRNWRAATEIVAAIAETLHYAHNQGLVHRDIKPSNILLDAHGKAHIVDFGLALRESDFGRGPRYAGTPAYMSPEQARGEGHRVDQRSDIYSLGAVLYELLVGRRTFTADSQVELLDQISGQEVTPPCQIDNAVPRELERICLKALAKRPSDRYATALDMAEDLRHFFEIQLATSVAATASGASVTARSSDSTTLGIGSNTTARRGTSIDSQAVRIVPKGLRSFDEHDANFFLELLPGPRDREGLPDSVRFWKTRIEETDADKTFSVGLIYGPSGCGKSSLVKAGLLPRLSQHVSAIYVEATADETEMRLLNGIHKHCPGLANGLGLKESLASLRRGEGLVAGGKVLLVLDQFEQWLHSHRNEEETYLAQALRQCDGGHIQCVVMVRDDFWMAATRFMRELESRLVEGHNSAAVDLFPVRHAQKVLAAFGRAFGALPESAAAVTTEQAQFLAAAEQGLAIDGKVVCVRLALFAEMMKSRPWTPASLRDVGGAEGVGVSFLEETFGISTAPPEHRLHQKAARALLKSLLPEQGTDIKGHMRPAEEVRRSSGYADRPRDFDDLIRVLDHELRLITPTDPEGQPGESTEPRAGGGYYQLTHDYLVPALREWLTRKQQETRRGRAELTLEERAAQWNAKPENRHLLSAWEFLKVLTLVSKRSWTDSQRQMMNVATRHYGMLACVGLAVLLVAAATLQQFLIRQHRTLVHGAVDGLQNTIGSGVPLAIRELERLQNGIVLEELQERFRDESNERRLPVAYALARFGHVESAFLVNALSTARAEECDNVLTGLSNADQSTLRELQTAADRATNQQDWVFKTRIATVAMHLGDESVAADMLRIEQRPDPIQRTMFIEHFPEWPGDVRKLSALFRNTTDAALRSGLSLAIGGIEEPAPDVKDTWRVVLADWFLGAPDGGSHSAAGWALRTWGLPLPEIPATERARDSRDWQLTPSGLTLIRIRPGEFSRFTSKSPTFEVVQKVKITSDCWFSDCEITMGLFRQFIEDKEYRSEFPGEQPDEWPGVDANISNSSAVHPAQMVNWYDAVMFCNWLSRREGRQPWYKKTGEKERVSPAEKEYDSWRLVEDASGYRLPTLAQSQHACLAGTTTEYSFGDNAILLSRYAVFAGNAFRGASAVGAKRCNAWGLFDIHGNVDELCHDWFGPLGNGDVSDPVGPDSGVSRWYRYGSWAAHAYTCRSSNVAHVKPSYRSNTMGFRIVLMPSTASGLVPRQPASGAESVSP